MKSAILAAAAEVIRKANREKPADAVLRTQFKNAKNLWRQDAREITQAVFAYYRWRNWVKPEAPPEQSIEETSRLAQEFSRSSELRQEELAAPSWVTREMTFSPDWLRVLQKEPRLWLRCKHGKRDEIADKIGDCSIPPYPCFSSTLEYSGDKDLFRTAEFHNGEFEMQDISSQAVGHVCAPKPGETWWDACAGEGGKLLHLSDLMQNKGLIWASDRAEWRLKYLKQRAARARAFNYRSALWDGSERLPTRTKFDGILVDAPCSGIGTWQRNPHARWTTTPEDVHELAAIQKKLLAHASSLLKPGGKLVYSVCTLTNAETEQVAAAHDAQFQDLKRLPLENPFKLGASKNTSLWLWPQDCGGSGMFVSAWVKQK